jgi:hypothetical protein
MCRAYKLSYLAGIIDGEGNISIHNYNYAKPRPYERHRVGVAVTNTDSRLMKWLKSNFGGGYYKLGWKVSNRCKDCYRWQISDQAAENILGEILPYLLIKKKRAQLALEFRKTVHYHERGSNILSQKTINLRETMKRRMNILNKKGR